MLIPVDTRSLTLLLVGEPEVALDYDTRLPRLDTEGRTLFRVPVILTGTGEKRAPSVEVTVPGPLPPVANGSPVTFIGLTLRTWTMRGNDGKERSGVTMRAEAMEAA